MQTIVELHLDIVCLKCVVLQAKSKLLRFLQCIGGGLEKNRISMQFVLRNIKRYRGVIQSEITKHVKKKNDKDEIGNIYAKRRSPQTNCIEIRFFF
jgi:hypothetical protein